MPPTAGRGRILSDAQEIAIVDMVIGKNAIKLLEIQDKVLVDNITFGNVNMVLEKHKIRMRYTVPFERNGVRVKELRYQYLQVRCLFNNQTGYIHSYAQCKVL